MQIVVKKGQATCPCCHTELDVISKVNGLGSKPFGNRKLKSIVKGYKFEILQAYLKEPDKIYTVKDIMYRINFTRFSKGITRMLEQCNMSRPHGELMDSGVIITVDDKTQPFKHKIDVEKAKALLN